MNTVIKNPNVNYSQAAKYFYSKAFKLAVPVKDSNNYIKMYGQYVDNGYISSDTPLSLAGNQIKLYIKFAGTGGSNNVILFDAVDSTLSRRIKVKAIKHSNSNLTRIEISYITSSGTKYVQIKSTNTQNTVGGIYEVNIDTQNNTISGKYYSVVSTSNVYSTEETNDVIEKGSLAQTFSNTTDDGGFAIDLIEGITIGKTTNVNTNTSKCGQLIFVRLTIDDVDKTVLSIDEGDATVKDWVTFKYLISHARTTNASNQFNSTAYRAFNKTNEDL